MAPDLFSTRQQELRGYARLHWLHWLIVGGSVLITGIAWHFSQSMVDERIARRFQREANDVVSLVQERLRQYEDALLSGVSMIQSHGGEISRDQWRRYATMLRLPERYPGISGIGVIRHVDSTGIEAFVERMRSEYPDYRMHPEHMFESHLPIAYVEPHEQNAAAVGLDVAFEKNRRDAALRAMSLGTTQVSGPIELIQDSDRTPGFLFYAPYYHDVVPGTSRRTDAFATTESSFNGFVYAPLVVRNLIAGVLDRENRFVSLSIRDDDTVLYDETDVSAVEDATLRAERDVSVYGRTWRFHIAATKGFAVGADSWQPLLVLVCGLIIDAMLLWLFWLMAGSNRKVLNLAENMTSELVARTEALSAANDKLASFAHVASHDLKSPLRNVQDIVGFLEEDLEEYLESENTNPEVRESLDFLSRQAKKGAALVEGILQYSVADVGEETQELIDTGAVIEEIRQSSGLSRDRLQLSGEFPVFNTYAVRLGQVLQNLIGNAVKFHDEPGNVRVRVGVTLAADRYHFEIEDNGPGIEPRFQERIFDAFISLNSRPDIDSTGIGLSIVRKSVESVGGSISVRSEPGHGATFSFDWPATVRDAMPVAA